MKKLTSILFIIVASVLVSCEGPTGPIGPPGADAEIGTIFELHGDFTSGNNYTLYTEFPNDLVVYDSDVVLAYILWDQVDGMDVWRLLPQTVVLKDNGSGETDVIQYNFDHTLNDVQVFLEFTVPANELLPSETDDQIFRIAVLPAVSLKKEGVDISNLSSLMSSPGIQMKSLGKIDLVTNLESNLQIK
uniref:hypothetical protein n=1 Tax=uncultured Draconibacterium sp. TaxID=1573823 RepID=UPI003217FADE